MSEKAIPGAAPSEEDMNTTPPNPVSNDGGPGWSMPEPVFRKTSGYLPQGFEKKFSQSELKPASNDNDSTAEMPAPDLAVDIEPQPEITDHGVDEPLAAAASPSAPKKSSAAKVVFTILGVILALALVVVFIAVIYILFLMPKPAGPFE